MYRVVAIIALYLVILFGAIPLAHSQQLVERKNTLIIRNDLGGPMANYIMRYSMMQKRGASIAIDGACESSCTLFLGFIPAQNTCVTANAKLGFHRSNRAEGTTVMLMNYPHTVLMWIMAVGLTEDMKFLPDDLMNVMFQRCPDDLINPPATEKVD